MFSLKRLNFLKIISGLAFTFALFLPSAHADGNILTSDNVTVKRTQFFEVGDDGNYVPATRKENHYYIRFEKDDPFIFIIPDQYLGDKESEFYKEGQTLYFYQPESDGPMVPLAISNRVLQSRAALLGAKKYFDQVCQDAGIKQTWWESGPIRVLFGNPSTNSMALASAGFWNHQISVKPDMITSFHLGSVVTHEYFHMVYDAVWYDGSSRTFFKKYSTNSKNPFSLYLIEMSAEWSTDEPVKYTDAITGKEVNQDDLNDYLLERSSFGFFDRNEDRFFDRGEYVSNVFIKYLAEQMAGAWGADQSGADSILKMVYATYNEGGVNKDTFFKNIAQAVMSNYWPGDWEEVWLNFYTAFCASNLVQKASANEKPDMPLGYCDDAFTNLQDMVWVKSDFIQDDATKVPPKVYSEPAKNDEERMERMETILGPDELIEPLAVKYHNLTFRGGRDQADPRPVFVFAKGTPESDVFLIRQRYKKEESSYNRKSAKFLWNDKFNFKEKHKQKEPKALGIYQDLKQGENIEDLWVGLVNPSKSLQSRVISYCWLASPRLVPHYYVPEGASSKTVRVMGGTAYTSMRPEGMRNGDTFEIEIHSAGALHRDGANVNDIAEEDRSLTFEALGSKNQKVTLEKQDGKEYKVRLQHAPSPGMMMYTYIISGKFAEKNSVTGDCHFKIKLTSPLNLGEGDEQIDESYKFKLNAVIPVIDRVRIRQAGELVYDNYARKTPESKKGFDFEVTVNFSMPMQPYLTPITAGIEAPYDKYSMEGMKWNAENTEVTGKFHISESDIPKSGAILRFAIGGEAQSGGNIDGDSIAVGNQPDTSHFLMLGIEEFYDLSISAEGKVTTNLRENVLNVDVKPLKYDLRLMPDIPDYYRGAPNVYIEHFQGQLQFLGKVAEHFEKESEKFEKELEVFRKDKNGYWNDLLKKKEAKLKQNKRVGNPGNNIPPQIRDLQKKAQKAYEDNMKKVIADMEKQEREFKPTGPDAAAEKAQFHKTTQENIKMMKQQIADQKSGKTLQDGMKRVTSEQEQDIADHKKTSADAAFNYREQYLKDTKRKVEFIRKDLMPKFEAATRMMMGLKQYRYIKPLSGPIKASFGGFTIEGKPASGWYSENYSDYKGKMGSFDVKTAHLMYQGFSTNDAGSLGKDIPEAEGPKLYTWDFEMEDYAKVRELANMAGKYPDVITQKFNAGPVRGIVGLDRNMEGESYQRELNIVPNQVDRFLLDFSKLAWGFLPVDKRPKRDEEHEVAEDGKVDPASLKMPDLTAKRLIRIESMDYLPRDFPIEFTGTTLNLSHRGSKDGMAWIPVYGTETSSNEYEGVKQATTLTHYSVEDKSTKLTIAFEIGRTEKTDWTIKSKMWWTGIVAPPEFFDNGTWVYGLNSTTLKNTKYGMEDTGTCKVDYDVIDNSGVYYVFYAQCDAEKISGTFTGKVNAPMDGDGFSVEGSWKTRFNLSHQGSGEKPAPKKAEPAPAPKPTAPEAPKPEPPKPPKAPEVKPGSPPWGKGYDPDSGITTESQGHPDGSRTVTKTDKDGKVISTETVPPPGERLPSGSSVDPYTGNKIEVQGNADGSRTVTRMDGSGKVLSQEILKP